MGGLSIWHWLVVGIAIMVLFGRGKISEMMGDVAKGIKAFKKGMADEEAPQPGEPTKTLDHQPNNTASPLPSDHKVG